MRGKTPIRKITPDPVYQSELVAKFINNVMLDGKKSVARQVVYSTFEEIKKKTKTEDPMVIFEEAIKNVSPSLEVRSRRVGGATYQVPREVKAERRVTLAIRWILTAARAKKGANMPRLLSEELIQASKNEGTAIKRKENTHRMAESNRAFAHFAW